MTWGSYIRRLGHICCVILWYSSLICSYQDTDHDWNGAASEPAAQANGTNGTTIEVKGQQHAPTVIRVKKGAAKNECAQQ